MWPAHELLGQRDWFNAFWTFGTQHWIYTASGPMFNRQAGSMIQYPQTWDGLPTKPCKKKMRTRKKWTSDPDPQLIFLSSVAEASQIWCISTLVSHKNQTILVTLSAVRTPTSPLWMIQPFHKESAASSEEFLFGLNMVTTQKSTVFHQSLYEDGYWLEMGYPNIQQLVHHMIFSKNCTVWVQPLSEKQKRY